MTPDVLARILDLLRGKEKSEEIQGELLDFVGFDNFEMLENLIKHREKIKEHCCSIEEKLNKEKVQTSYKPSNFSTGANRIGVGVEFRSAKQGKKGKKHVQMPEQKNITNYDILLKMGFKDESIRENKLLGLKETTRIQLDQYLQEDAVDQ